MSDNFFSKTSCDKCGGSLKTGRIMSMFSEEVLCMECKEQEKNDKDYKEAVQTDIDEIKKGNYNFMGIRGGTK
jgi:hypothetical protein